MSTIADWLRSLGMSEYAQRFAENDIDIPVLPELTDQHLKDLGVSLGRRLKMMRAIREIGGDTSVTAQPPVVTGQKPQDAAERRQLTVMFVDLVGSTALSARLDPEEFLKRTVVGFQWVSRVILRVRAHAAGHPTHVDRYQCRGRPRIVSLGRRREAVSPR